MKICPNCGVELDENANYCSLCGEPLADNIENAPSYLRSRKTSQEQELLSGYQKLTGLQKRKIIWKISWIILGTGMIITAIIDLTVNHTITWSEYPLSVSLVVFVNISLILFLYRRILLLLLLSFLSSSGLLIILDFFAGKTGWGMNPGIPILLAAYVTIFFLILMIKNSNQKGLNIIAFSLLAAGMMCICTDGIISVYQDNKLSFGWSLIVFVSATIVSLLLLYIHYRLKRVTDLKRFFHI